MKYLYLIPARGGSKGIPGKNIKPLGGIPLIGHTIRGALAVCSDPEDVIVSTDSEEIAAIAAQFGANIPFLRPAEFAGDSSSSRSVIINALEMMKDLKGKDYDTVVLLQPTSPLRTPDDIIATVEAFERSRLQHPDDPAMMAVTVTEARTNPYYSAFETDADGFLHISKGDGHFTRRQDAPEVWEFNGAVYVIDAQEIRNSEISHMKRIIPVEMPSERSLDLDTIQDWARAEQIFSTLPTSKNENLI